MRPDTRQRLTTCLYRSKILLASSGASTHVPLYLKDPLRTFGRLFDEHCHIRLDARWHGIRRLIGRLFRGRSTNAKGARSTVSREKHPAFRQMPLKRLIAKAATENMRPTTYRNNDGVI